MTATLTTRLEWVVTIYADEDHAGTETYADEADAVAVKLALLDDSVQVYIDRVEVTLTDDTERGIAAGSEWIANADSEPGTLWERIAENRTPNVTQPQWERMNVARNQLGTRAPGVSDYPFSDPRGPIALDHPHYHSGSIKRGVLQYAPITRTQPVDGSSL